MYLVKLDENSYSAYQRSMRKVQYSLTIKGKSTDFDKEVRDAMNDTDLIFPKQKYIDEINKPNISMYILKDDANNNIGICILKFEKKICYIQEFAVFEKLQGYGTAFYRMIIAEVIQPKNYKEIRLICPSSFLGAQKFWEKMGFTVCLNKKQPIFTEFFIKIK